MVNGGTLVQPRVVKSVGQTETTPVYKGRVMTTQLSKQLQGLMHHVVKEVAFYREPHADPGLRGRRQDRHRPDLGREATHGLEGQQVQLLVRRLHRASPGPPRPRRRGPDRGGHAHGHPPGDLEMPVMSFELFRRIAHDAISDARPDPDRPSRSRADAGGQPVTTAYATLAA